MQTADCVSISRSLDQGGHAAASATHQRIASVAAYYSTPFERELAIANLKWMSAHAPSHVAQVECRMLLLAMRCLQSFGAP